MLRESRAGSVLVPTLILEVGSRKSLNHYVNTPPIDGGRDVRRHMRMSGSIGDEDAFDAGDVVNDGIAADLCVLERVGNHEEARAKLGGETVPAVRDRCGRGCVRALLPCRDQALLLDRQLTPVRKSIVRCVAPQGSADCALLRRCGDLARCRGSAQQPREGAGPA